MASFLKILLALLIGLYALSWLISPLIWLQFRQYHNFTHDPPDTINGASLHVELNEGTVECQWVGTPFLSHCVNDAPYTLVLQIVDPAGSATTAQIHRASLETADGGTVALSLQDGTDRGPSLPFVDDVGDRTVHVYHDEELPLSGAFTLSMDISVVRGQKAERKTVTIAFQPAQSREVYLATVSA